MSTDSFKGILFIGDPHLASRNPGFRKDDYPRAILEKLRWCLQHAKEQQYLPVLLGDLFHWPQDNANWLLTDLLQLFLGRTILAVTGNHDTTERRLIANDSLSVIHAAGGLTLVDQQGPWRGQINGKSVVIGGTQWSEPIPKEFDRAENELVIWVTHHNIRFGGIEEQWLKPKELPGIDIVVNGHIHTPYDDLVFGQTTWMNPGNIARVQRAEGVRTATPRALALTIDAQQQWQTHLVEIPHQPFDEVFYELGIEEELTNTGSEFIKGLESLRMLKTADGSGLMEFLNQNLQQFEPAVQTEILSLAREVCDHDEIG